MILIWYNDTMGSKLGALKVAAKRIGMSFENYMAKRNAGLKRCMACKRWLSRDQFGKSKIRGDGLEPTCLDCITKRYTIKEVGTRERRAKRAIGLYWCKNCRDWQPRDLMVFSSSGSSTGLCREHYNIYQQKQYKSNPERRRKAYLSAKERKAKAKPISANEKQRLLELFDGQCAYCRKRPFEEWDHFVPLKHGGKSVPGNILPSCLRCNRSKHAENPFEWIAGQDLEFSEAVLQVISTPPEQVVYKHRRNPNQVGELNPTAKLTNAQAEEIRKRYTTGEHSYSSLAQEYNVGRWVISRIARGETYNGDQD